MIPLHLLSPGQSAWVDQIVGSVEQVRRLAELGVQRGAAVAMVRSGGACIIEHDGRRLCFRESDEVRIFVRPVESTIPLAAKRPVVAKAPIRELAV